MRGHYFCFVNFLLCSRIQDRIQARRYYCKGTATICDCVRHQREIKESLSDVEASLTVKPPRNNLLMINLVGYTRLHCSLRKTIKTEPLDIQEAKIQHDTPSHRGKYKHSMVRNPHLFKDKLLRIHSITSKMLRRCPQQQKEDSNDDQAEVTDINLQDLDAGKLNEKLQQLPSTTNKRQQNLKDPNPRNAKDEISKKLSFTAWRPKKCHPETKDNQSPERTRCQSKSYSNPTGTREIPPLICCKNMVAKNQQNAKNKGQDNKDLLIA